MQRLSFDDVSQMQLVDNIASVPNEDAFAISKRDLEDGIAAVRSTLSATAGDGSLIGLCEVIESSWLVPTASGHEVKREFFGARRPREPDAERRL